jgi:hypothetical protein
LTGNNQFLGLKRDLLTKNDDKRNSARNQTTMTFIRREPGTRIPLPKCRTFAFTDELADADAVPNGSGKEDLFFNTLKLPINKLLQQHGRKRYI